MSREILLTLLGWSIRSLTRSRTASLRSQPPSAKPYRQKHQPPRDLKFHNELPTKIPGMTFHGTEDPLRRTFKCLKSKVPRINPQ